ncbi:MAG TPA: class I SAM-dependent methyltransferase [Tahibacter sp.]|uniref:class I SAM-dependent methyltransferase n=1 Tax=Tahibacter sp. TaxID=2056211 RepID=UPI002B769A8D|nr:class I SAM-dependent methyltransferase [Tahibacter sp.]HSX60671.1 class I SAM-dependent methyltransferase [Tahibacter sp.]
MERDDTRGDESGGDESGASENWSARETPWPLPLNFREAGDPRTTSGGATARVALVPDSALQQHESDAAARYGDGCAEFYDEIYAPASRAAVDRLVALAAGGPVLEAGVGTGRYALPLSGRGVAVHGVDASAAMLDALRRKAGGAAITMTLGDFSLLSMENAYRLIVCLTNTLSLLTDARRQAQAIARFATALHDSGALLLETTYTGGDTEAVATDIALRTRAGMRRYRVDGREVDVATLDAWAACAGLHCAARWRDWRGTPWRGELGGVLSLYRKNPRQRRDAEPSGIIGAPHA